jgi:transcriptional regulator GlxA family with amidase domain
MQQIAVLALPNVIAFDLAVPCQVFGHPDEVDRYHLIVCGPLPGAVPTTTGYEVVVTSGLEALASADTVIVAGYFPHSAPPEPVTAALRAAVDRGSRVVSICTGAFALAAAGLLDGRRATTHWRDAAELAERYPAVLVDPNVLYVDDEVVRTSAGIAAGIDLCLHLVREDHGAAAAIEVARRMVVAPHRPGGQAQLLRRPIPAASAGLAPTMQWALQHLNNQLSVAELARHAGCAPRTFARHFVAETGTTPQRWLTTHRVNEARRLLEVTHLSIEQVAQQAGLGTSANLRLLLARDTATTPGAYRRTYQGDGQHRRSDP